MSGHITSISPKRAPKGQRGGGLISAVRPVTKSPAATLFLAEDSDDEEDVVIVDSSASSSSKAVDAETATAATPRPGMTFELGGMGAPPPKKRKVAPKAAKTKEKKGKTLEELFLPSVPWPEHFHKLERTFKALNTVYTFCSARKSMSTTFEVLQGSVEKLLGRPLEMQDIGQMKSLLPELITFAYIDSELLRIHASGSEGDPRSRDKQHELDEEYERAARGPTDDGDEAPSGKSKKDVVLLFKFNDGELKSINGVGKVITRKWQRRKKSDDGQASGAPADKVPKFSKESMTALIEKRNVKFTAAVNELLVACAAHQPPGDPVSLLLSATIENLPVKPGEGGEEERKGLREKQEDLEFFQRNPEKRPPIESIIREIREQDEYRDQIVEDGHRVFNARDAVYGDLDEDLSEPLWDALYATKKITQLYSHQAQAINHLSSGRNVIVSTSTSSGKSLIYQIPAVKALERDPASTCIYIYPTKALAQDQRGGLQTLLANHSGMENVEIATFDGDTHRDDRDSIRENANIIFTNPDMLHLTVLPRENTWRRFFCNLKFVVVDELHTYAGLFGCHVAFVMRRLRRVCAAVGNNSVQFISCSATIANPKEHMGCIFGCGNIEVVDVDGSPSGTKEFLIWNPPYIDDKDIKQGRVSTIAETSRLFRFLMQRGIRAIVFCKVRQQCEILMKQVRADLMLEGRSDMASRVASYRSGYSAADRRKIEQDMFSGQLLGIVATTALELGVDIGSLDAVITLGFPYTLPGLRQQAGRAGRRNKDSMAMLICDPWPLDQHYARNPEEIFSSPFQQLALDLDNPIVLEAHIQCAADEVPVQIEEDRQYFGDRLEKICRERLVRDDQGYYHCHPRYKPYPAKAVPIRNTEDDAYSIVDISDGRNAIIEEVEISRAIFTTYEGAIYMHMGRTFVVKEVSHERKIAKVERATIDWRTRQRDFTNIDPLEPLAIREIKGEACTASYGLVQITTVVFGYFKTDMRNNILDTVDLNSPPFIRQSHGFWIDVPARALEILLVKNFHPAASIHAAEHALMSLTPIVAMCTEGDVRTECKQPEKELASMPSSRKRPARLILYDSAGMSGGICAKAFDHISMLVQQAADTIANCKCSDGCPSCVAARTCSGANTIVSKLGALIVLDCILGREIDIDSIPTQEPAFGVTPGGTLDLAAAGVRADIRQAAERGPVTVRSQVAGVMESQELGDDERRERDAALAELLGGGTGDNHPPGGNVAESPRMEGREVYDLAKTGGWVQGR